MLAIDPLSSAEPIAEPISWSQAEFPRTMLVASILFFFLALCLGCSSSARLAASGAASTAGSGSGSDSGSGAGSGSSSGSGSTETSLVLAPANTTIQAGQTIQFALSGQASDATCTWTSSSAAILALIGDQEFQGQQVGNATVSVVCGTQSVQAIVSVIAQVAAASGPITITSGGTYSGTWNSDDPSTPAVTIATDAPVTLEDSVLTSRGGLIRVSGVSTGANVTIDNVSGTALDPQVAGVQRGIFVFATKINSLIVKNCTMTGVSFGVNATTSTVSTIQILNNMAVNLDDRPSDGQGGLLAKEPDPGHFIFLNAIVAPSGAEIAWNQVMQTIGQSSTTDVINLYRSQGSAGHPLWVHDNYIEGDSSPVNPTAFSGVGIIADGSETAPVTAFALFENNEIVHTAGSGVSIDNGHDITATGNRVVSCGQDSAGNWFAVPFANAVSIWDSYGLGPSLFYNNTITDSAGGLVRPNSTGGPMAADSWGSALSMSYPGNSIGSNEFTNPCLANGQLNLAAEDAERAYWAAKVAAASEQIGDQHAAAQ
jgi:plastocyanin